MITDETSRVHHGRTLPTSALESRASTLFPGRELNGRENLAILSPIFLATSSIVPTWIDLYDDWSIAPDINPIHRYFAKSGYTNVSKTSSKLVTVNSEYMVRKIGRSRVKHLPNGVDETLALMPQRGDAQRRLIIFGHFFSGRTDFKLIRNVIELGIFDEIVVGGIGKDRRSRKFFDEISKRVPEISIRSWISEEELARISGKHTVALIPNIVSDYTLSQDLMKAYTFMALGIPTICPMPLWPQTIPKTYAFLTGHGDKMASNLLEWLGASRPNSRWRSKFVDSNSWTQRAKQVAEWL